MMSRLLASLLACAPLLPIAHADEVTPGVPASSADTRATALPPARIALAVNPPIRWFTKDTAFGASLYVGFATHHVVRANVARYPYGDIFASETSYDGLTTDLGASYMYFPRRAFDGYFVDAGFVHRTEDGTALGPFWEQTSEKTTFYGGRAMIGWSWLVGDTFFTSLQFGASIGHVRGTREDCDTGCMDDGDPPTTTRISTTKLVGEGMIRIGIAFDAGT